MNRWVQKERFSFRIEGGEPFNNRLRGIRLLALAFLLFIPATGGFAASLQEYPVPKGSHPHDVAPAPDGSVWYTAQAPGELGRLDPKTGKTTHVRLGPDSHPHGVIIGPDGAPWVTDGGMNGIVRVDPVTQELKAFFLPGRADANLNTATFDHQGILWFTGQSGVYGRLDPKSGRMALFDAPKGRGPYGIATAPDGSVYYASLAGNHIARIDLKSGAATVITPPTPDQGARRVWPDSRGRIWVSEWNSGQVSVYDPMKKSWKAWRAPGLGSGKVSKRSVSGSKRSSAFPPKSLSQTLS